MKASRIVKLMGDHKMIGNLRHGIFVTSCVVLIVIGCAQTKSYEPPVTKTMSDGLAAAGNFHAVAVEDLDNDGNLDVIGGAARPGMVTINYGDGRGGISEPQILPVKGDVRSVAVADINADGLNDIVFCMQRVSFGIRVWLNESNRKWRNSAGPIEINNYQSVRTADVNGDGHMDIIAANATSETQEPSEIKGGIQVWLGDGQGDWYSESGPTVDGIYMDVAVADLNGDRALDLVGAGWGTYGALRVWYGDGAGNWSAASVIMKGSFYGIRIDDLNGDGNPDILAGSYRAGARIFLGDGRGDFIKTMSPAEYLKRRAQAHPEQYKDSEKEINKLVEESFWTILPVDLNNDGALDILAGSINQKGMVAWINKGQNRWVQVKGLFPTSGNYYEITAADIDNDNYLDIIAASLGEGIKLWPGTAGAELTTKQMDIEQLADKNRLAVLEAPLENNVYATINGVAEYKIGPGDVLEITFWDGNTPTKEEILVKQDGTISFGFIEDLPIGGLTSSQLDELLTKHIKEYLRKPRIDIVVKEYNSKTLTLLGALLDKRQAEGGGAGIYKLKGKTTLLQAITRVGGPARDADLKNVIIRRKNGRTISLDLFMAIQKGKPEQDFILDDGDVVFIPTIDVKGNRVYVFGEVNKPGAYAYNSEDMRLFDAVAEAGGPTIYAARSNTKIVRGDPTKPEIITADLERLEEEGDYSQNIILAKGDLVYVPRSGFGEINLFNKRIRPLFEMILWPARTVIDWYNAADIIKSGGDVD